MTHTEITYELVISEGVFEGRGKLLIKNIILWNVSITYPHYLCLGASSVTVKVEEIDKIAQEMMNFSEIYYEFMTSDSYDLLDAGNCNLPAISTQFPSLRRRIS